MDNSMSLQSGDGQPIPNSTLLGMSAEEVQRHQQTGATYVHPGDSWHGSRIGTFPMPNRRPAGVREGKPDAATLYRPHPQANGMSGNYGSHSPSPSSVAAGGSSDHAAQFESLFRQMPGRDEDPERYRVFLEIVKLRTRGLELEIAQARQKEREAELELQKLRRVVGERGPDVIHDMDMMTQQVGTQMGQASASDTQPQAILPSTVPYGNFPFINHARPPVEEDAANAHIYPQLSLNSTPTLTGMEQQPTPMTTFDIDTLLQDSNLDDLLSLLPGSEGNSGQIPSTLDPSLLMLAGSQMHADPKVQDLQFHNGPEVSDSQTMTRKRRSSTNTSETENPISPPHATKRSKRFGKRGVVEGSSTCSTCSAPLCRVLVRAPITDMPQSVSLRLQCPQCQPVECLTATKTDVEGSAPTGVITTLEQRKRMKISMEIDDEGEHKEQRRIFCDVCQRLLASGQVTDGTSGESLLGMSEIICVACDKKYQRCTDCGGGGGSRIGIGKWRLKQVFQPGRKTCSLSHNRIGDRHREIGVHVTPTDFKDTEFTEVLSRCRSLWKEKTLARLAVPEMLELELAPGVTNPIEKYRNIEEVIQQKWPGREAMIKAEGADPKRFKRLLTLIWAHPRPRKSVKTVDLEEEHAKVNGDDKAKHTVLANVTHTDVIIPAGSDLVGMWGAEWDMEHGSLLISTLIPFEGADGEDTTALSVGEMITKVQALRNKINDERKAQAKPGQKVELLPLCEHLWVVSNTVMPLIRERVADVLIKKRSFVTVEEYLTRHPEFIHALNARPRGLHPDLAKKARLSPSAAERDLGYSKPLILVRWLGRDFGAQRVLEIKRQEFGASKQRAKRQAKDK